VTADGLDEVSLDGPTRVLWIENGTIETRVWTCDDFGLPRVTAEELRVDGPEHSAALLRQLLEGTAGPIRSIVLANAAAALLAARHVDRLRCGVEEAAQSIDSRRASELLRQWIAIAKSPSSPDA
jgi:anthranilate phosphoribosyltransferase